MDIEWDDWGNYVGALFGCSSGFEHSIIRNTYSTGKVVALGDGDAAGGLVGGNKARIVDSYSIADVTADGYLAEAGGKWA